MAEKKYRIKDGFVLREVAGNYIVVAVGDAVKHFNGVVNLNETGVFLWKKLAEGGNAETLKDALMKEYEVDEATALRDAQNFIRKLSEGGMLS